MYPFWSGETSGDESFKDSRLFLDDLHDSVFGFPKYSRFPGKIIQVIDKPQIQVNSC